MRGRLRTAAREVQVPVGLEARVRDRLRQSREPQAKKFHLMALAATLAICFGSWAAYRGARSSSAVAALMRFGLGDHVHCGVIRQAGSSAQPTVDKFPANYKELIPIVRQRVAPHLPLVLAHECHYQGRKFVHLTFRDNRNLLSLVITRRQNGESLGAGVHTAGVNQCQSAAFESGNFLVYAISDLPQQGNLAVLVALAPALNNFLNQIGA